MKAYSKRLYQNKVMCNAGEKFSIEGFLGSNVLDDEEMNTVKFKYDSRVVYWESQFNIEDLSQDQIISLFTAYLIKSENVGDKA